MVRTPTMTGEESRRARLRNSSSDSVSGWEASVTRRMPVARWTRPSTSAPVGEARPSSRGGVSMISMPAANVSLGVLTTSIGPVASGAVVARRSNSWRVSRCSPSWSTARNCVDSPYRTVTGLVVGSVGWLGRIGSPTIALTRLVLPDLKSPATTIVARVSRPRLARVRAIAADCSSRPRSASESATLARTLRVSVTTVVVHSARFLIWSILTSEHSMVVRAQPVARRGN